MLERLRDYFHERRIKRLRRELLRVHPAIRPAVWAVLRDMIMSRSADQVARMERQRGLA